MSPNRRPAAPARASAAPASLARSPRLALAATLFFCSGALGLGYELVWIRKAALVVGASQLALSTVLTSFFLGLGLGSLWIGRLRRSRRSPLATYGLFELGIGLWALFFPELFGLLRAAYGALHPLVAESEAALFGLRFVLLFALCLPPTFLMGGTLPLLLDGLVSEQRSIGSRASFLYGINILGAVAGVLLTCYLAIPAIGMDGTSRAGGLANLAIGGVALLAFRARSPLHAPQERGPAPERAHLQLAFASGAVAIAWQVMHARFLGLLEVTTVHTTALLLTVYLLALSLGSLALGLALRVVRGPLRLFAFAQLLVPAAGLYSFHLARHVNLSFQLAALQAADGQRQPLETMQVRPYFAFFSEDLDRVLFGPLAQIALVVFVPVLFLGACLPALIAAGTKSAGALRRSSGALVFWNTLGSSAGAFLAGYLLLPALGMHGSLALLGLASLLLAAFAWRAEGARPAPAAVAVGATSLVAVCAFAFALPDLTRTAIERYGILQRLDDPTWHAAGYERPVVDEIVEGAVSTAYIVDSSREIRLVSGGVSFAGVAKQGIPGQAVQGHIPVLLFPGEGVPERCLGICVGSGQSFGAMLMYPIERLDVVDIDPALVRLSLRRFAEYNHGLEHDPRVRFFFDDGRHFVERAPDSSYEVVSMEPPPPNADGVYALYSRDFYLELRRVLSERGLLMQWLPLYRISPEDAQCIVATQAAVFPETFVVKQSEQDFMVLSYKTRPTFVQEEIRRRCETFAQERMVAGARWAEGCRAELASFEGVVSTLLIGPPALAAMEAPAIYEDDTQLLAYGTGDRWIYQRYGGKHLARIAYAALPQSPMAELAAYFDPPLDAGEIAFAEEERARSLVFFREPDPRILAELARRAADPDPSVRRIAELSLASQEDARLQKARAFDHLARAIALEPGAGNAEEQAVARGLVRNHYSPYRALIGARVEALRRAHPSSPLVLALRRAVEESEPLEAKRRELYFFPER